MPISTSPTAPRTTPFTRFSTTSVQNWPFVGPIVFGQNLLVYLSWLCVVAVSLYLGKTRLGLNVRAVGESPAAADAMGIDVVRYRYAHTLVGGAFAGVAGATFTLAITPQWVSGITGGAGWIAIALVIFAFWRPELCLVGAYFFGALQALAPELQARQIELGPTELWTTALPYVMTIVVLVLASASGARRRLGAPLSLGTPYVREEALSLRGVGSSDSEAASPFSIRSRSWVGRTELEPVTPACQSSQSVSGRTKKPAKTGEAESS